MEKLWRVWGIGVPQIILREDSFDEVLAEARKRDERYSSGQVIENEECI